ncbi:MAG TPA: hypothetical protein VFX49_02045 [Chloroflexota bacterium]|nr:hypothetical protein [Chloroflexota bacterium]
MLPQRRLNKGQDPRFGGGKTRCPGAPRDEAEESLVGVEVEVDVEVAGADSVVMRRTV